MNRKSLIFGVLVLVIMLGFLTGCESSETTDNKLENDQNQIKTNTAQNEENVTKNEEKDVKEDNKMKSSNTSKNTVPSRFKIGDYVEYNAGVGNSYIAKAEKTGYSNDQEFVTTGEEKWKVLSINDDGTINITTEEAIGTKYDKELFFKGEVGYNNSVDELNKICRIYANNPAAVSARSMNDQDINNLFDMNAVIKYYQNKYETDITGTDRDEQLNQIYNLIYPSNGETKTVNGRTATYNEKFNWDTSGTGMRFNAAITDDAKQSVANIKNQRDVWLANKIVGCDGVKGKVTFGIYHYGYYRFEKIYANDLQPIYIYDVTNDRSSERGKYIRPVVTVKIDADATGDGTEANPFVIKATSTSNSASDNATGEGIEVGGTLVKFGTYNGDAAVVGDTLVIKSDGTATLNGVVYSYNVASRTFSQDSSQEDTRNAIVLNGSNKIELFVEDGGSRLTQGSGMDYIYSEN